MKLIAGVTMFSFSDIYASSVEEFPNITDHKLIVDYTMLGPIVRACEDNYQKKNPSFTPMDREMCFKGMAYAYEHKIKGKHKDRSYIAICYYSCAFVIVMHKKKKYTEEEKKRILSMWNDDQAPLRYLRKYHPHIIEKEM